MVTFLCSYIKQFPGNISVLKDGSGNLYVIKGEAETYLCLVSRVDQVSRCDHSKDFRVVETREVVFSCPPKHKRFENLGTDDRSGVFICLECPKKYGPMKVVFFREEETGRRGSSEAVISFFDDVRFIIQPNRKGNLGLITNIGYSDLCPEGFIGVIGPEKRGYMKENGSTTDILTLREKGLEVSCFSVSCGYYDTHTGEETMVKKGLMKSLPFVEHIIEDCAGTYSHTRNDPYFSPYEFGDEAYDILSNDSTPAPESLCKMCSIDFLHLRPNDCGRICGDHRMLWREYEEYKLISGSGYENEKILS